MMDRAIESIDLVPTLGSVLGCDTPYVRGGQITGLIA
jgi:hypothetical protein